MILVIVTSLRHFLRWTVSAFSSRQNLILENLALRQQLLCTACQTTSSPIDYAAEALLGCLTTTVARMGTSSRAGHPQNRGGLASGKLPVVLDMGLKSQTGRRRLSARVENLGPTWVQMLPN
jgi:hypothetical protein